LPFVVEERIVAWELQGYTNTLVDEESGDTLTDALGGEQFFFTLYNPNFESLKPKRKQQEAFELFLLLLGVLLQLQ
jgi:hypothetical protein